MSTLLTELLEVDLFFLESISYYQIMMEMFYVAFIKFYQQETVGSIKGNKKSEVNYVCQDILQFH